MENQIAEVQVGSVGDSIGETDVFIKSEPQKRKVRKGIVQLTTSELQDGVGKILADEEKTVAVKVTFDGEAAVRIHKLESELRERLSKPDLGKILGREILALSEKRWMEIIEENTDVEFFFAQIRKYGDRGKSIKLLKSLAEKLKSEGQSEGVKTNIDDRNDQESQIAQ